MLSVIAPGDTVFLDSSYAPAANVGNFGDVNVTFDVCCVINGYADTQTVFDLPPINQIMVTFDDWSVPPVDSFLYIMTVYTLLPADTVPSNDTLTKQIFARDGAGPIPDSALASDGAIELPGIDDDDYVLFYFDEPTNKPTIDAVNIDVVLSLSGGHTWLDGFGSIGSAVWNPLGDRLMVNLSVNVGPPTVAVGDTVVPDGSTITDEWGNPCDSPVILTGYFSPFHNVGVFSIDAPPDTVFTDSTYAPLASLANRGNKTESLAVTCAIDGYADTVAVTGFSPAGTTQAVFSLWAVPPDDSVTYLVTVAVMLDGDSVPGDDTLRKTVFVRDGTGPVPDSAFASDGSFARMGIDEDDYVLIHFNESTNKPVLDSSNIDTVLKLSSGHSWLDGVGNLLYSEWDSAGKQLSVFLAPLFGVPPTISVGDTIYPDGVTIQDVWGNACTKWVTLGGTFDPTG
ncbi:MAG: hypothetical protein ACE5JA_10015, partial [bacterium]